MSETAPQGVFMVLVYLFGAERVDQPFGIYKFLFAIEINEMVVIF